MRTAEAEHRLSSAAQRDCMSQVSTLRLTIRVKPGASRAKVAGSYGEGYATPTDLRFCINSIALRLEETAVDK